MTPQLRNTFREEMDDLNNHLKAMSEMVVTSLKEAMQILEENNAETAQKVIAREADIGKLADEIENLALHMLLTQQPLASDFKEITSTMRLIPDLERIGSQAKDIVSLSMDINEHVMQNETMILRKICGIAGEMLGNAVNSFITKDKVLAQETLKMDDEINMLYRNVKKDIVNSCSNMPTTTCIEAINTVLIAKYLERIGDHSKNICRWVVFS